MDSSPYYTMKVSNLKAAMEEMAAQQSKIINTEAPYVEYDPYID